MDVVVVRVAAAARTVFVFVVGSGVTTAFSGQGATAFSGHCCM